MSYRTSKHKTNSSTTKLSNSILAVCCSSRRPLWGTSGLTTSTPIKLSSEFTLIGSAVCTMTGSTCSHTAWTFRSHGVTTLKRRRSLIVSCGYQGSQGVPVRSASSRALTTAVLMDLRSCNSATSQRPTGSIISTSGSITLSQCRCSR